MAGVPGRSGGANRLSLEEHLKRGTYTRSRHGHLKEEPAVPLTPAVRRRTLRGLTGDARASVLCVLDEYTGWNAPALVTLRQWALAVMRIDALTAQGEYDREELRRELRMAVALFRALNLK
jgi:hypothetical protein